MPVNKGRVALAVAALRSGLYLRGPGYLHNLREVPPEFDADFARGLREQNPDAYPGWWCCLGVLGDVAIRFGLVVERHLAEADTCESVGGSSAYLSPEVRDWYGLPDTYSNDLLLTSANGRKLRASLWNDDPSATFEDIARGFERTFLQEESVG